jgi:hypothetical protein
MLIAVWLLLAAPAIAAPDHEARADDGAAETWWSLRPLVRPAVPPLTTTEATWARNPVDAFILAKRREHQLSPAPAADRRTLLRRLSFDLLGLPPAPEAIDAFLADPDPLAYEKLVDRLLASPHYGERWARHWLDVVHYGETHGYDKDKPRPHAWPYRDYVIRAFNEDKPYGRFVQEQVAGDVLFPETRDGIEALGFLAAGPWDFIGHAEVPESKIDGQIARHLDRDDMVSNTLTTFNSLTVHCAQCHEHKFDPISQEDYYSLQAVFAALDRADKPYDVDPGIALRRAALAEHLRQLERQAKRAEAAQVQREIAQLPSPQRVYAGTVYSGSGAFRGTGADGGKPRVIHVLRRGDVRRPGKEVGPGALSALAVLVPRFELPPGAPEGARRAALTQWLTDRRNPLTWRSIVNRVWLYHFGRGLVDTPNDFGRMGQPPTHPELLDWLAAEFRDHGQSLKHLHRLLVTSATYRQASVVDLRARALDADNALYGRMNRRRLEAEAVRDSILYVSGQLDQAMTGPSFQDFVLQKPEHSPHYEYQLHDPEDPHSHRRSVYRFLVRSRQQPFLAALDCADPSLLVDKRQQTITPAQALALLNDSFTAVMARHFAERVLGQAGGDVTTQVRTAVRLALGRAPTPEELDALASYTRDHGLANTCRVILNLSEFLFAD